MAIGGKTPTAKAIVGVLPDPMLLAAAGGSGRGGGGGSQRVKVNVPNRSSQSTSYASYFPYSPPVMEAT